MITVEEDTFADYEVDSLLGGGGRPKKGVYHMQCIEAIENENPAKGAGYTELKFEVVGPGSEIGKKMPLRLFHKANPDGKSAEEYAKANASVQRRLIGFAIALRVISHQQYEEARAARKGLDLDFERAMGAQAIIEIVDQKEEYTDQATGEKRRGVEIPWTGIHDLSDPKFQNVPLETEIAALWGVKREQDNPFSNPQQQAAASQPAKATTQTAKATPPQQQQPVGAGASSNKWEDI